MLALLLIAATTIQFAHTPEWLQSKAKPETKLYGISLNETIGAVKHRLGKPESVKRFSHATGGGEDGGKYTWHRGGVRIDVETYYQVKGNEEPVFSITVRSDKPAPDAKTSRGVHLGGTLDDLVRVYGSRYRTEYDEHFAEHDLDFIFVFEDESELHAGIDSDHGNITVLRIESSIE